MGLPPLDSPYLSRFPTALAQRENQLHEALAQKEMYFRISEAASELNADLRAQLAQMTELADEWKRTLTMAGCVKDEKSPCGWRNERAERAEAQASHNLKELLTETEMAESALKEMTELAALTTSRHPAAPAPENPPTPASSSPAAPGTEHGCTPR